MKRRLILTKRLTLLIVLVVGIGTRAILVTAMHGASNNSVTAPAAALSDTKRESDSKLSSADHAAEFGAATARTSYREVTIPAGTPLRLRLESSVASNASRVEDAVQAHLMEPIVVNGRTVVPANSRATGHVTAVRRSAKVKGRGYVAMRFTELTPARGKDRYRITTRVWAREAPGTKKQDAVKIGVPAGVGAVVGGILGGKSGAGIGAAVGGGAGTGMVLATRGQEVRVGRGAVVLVRLSSPLPVRVPA
jgi:hypothetical protein